MTGECRTRIADVHHLPGILIMAWAVSPVPEGRPKTMRSLQASRRDWNILGLEIRWFAPPANFGLASGVGGAESNFRSRDSPFTGLFQNSFGLRHFSDSSPALGQDAAPPSNRGTALPRAPTFPHPSSQGLASRDGSLRPGACGWHRNPCACRCSAASARDPASRTDS